MVIGELDNPDASDGRELPPAPSSDAQAHPENSRASADRGQRPDTARHPRAETLTRQEYSDAMRAQGPPAPSRDSARDDPLATAPRGAPAPDRADRGRGEYADAIHALPAEDSQQHQIFRLDASGRSDSSADLAEATEGPSGDSADEVAQGEGDRTGPDDQPAPPLKIDSSQQDRPLYREGPEDTSPQDVLPTAGLSQASTPTDELNGQGLDTVAGEQPRDLDDADNATGGDDKAYVDGREYDVTHKSADGIWVSGLPGEMPGTPYGDPYGTARVGEVLPGDAPPRSRADRLFSTFCERGDDLVDIAEKGLNEMQDILAPRPPTITEAPVHVSQAALEMPYNEIDAGSMATALLAFGVGVWGLHRMWERRHEMQAGPEKGT